MDSAPSKRDSQSLGTIWIACFIAIWVIGLVLMWLQL
jgi:hypothetical protein